jgi:Leucine Rich repeat
MTTAKDEIEKILASSDDDGQVASALFRFSERWGDSDSLEEELALIERRFSRPVLAAANRWIERAFVGEPEPRLRLCSRFIVTGPYAYKIRGAKLGDEHIENLCRADHLGGVRYFATTVSHKFGPRSFAAFANGKTLCNLRELDLSHSKPGKSGMAALGSGPSLSKLETLRVFDAAIDGKQLEAFCKGSALSSLTDLVLSRNSLGAHGASALAASSLESLTRLDLHQCALDLASVRALAGSQALARLKTLKLDNNASLVGDVCDALSRATFASSLEALDLSYTELTASGLATLLQSAPSLRELHVRSTGIATVEPLLAPRATPLTKLWLDDCPIDAAQLEALIASPAFKFVTELGVAGTRIGDKGLAALARADLSSLTALNASGSNMSRAAWQSLVDNTSLSDPLRATLATMTQYLGS